MLLCLPAKATSDGEGHGSGCRPVRFPFWPAVQPRTVRLYVWVHASATGRGRQRVTNQNGHRQQRAVCHRAGGSRTGLCAPRSAFLLRSSPPLPSPQPLPTARALISSPLFSPPPACSVRPRAGSQGAKDRVAQGNTGGDARCGKPLCACSLTVLCAATPLYCSMRPFDGQGSARELGLRPSVSCRVLVSVCES